MFLVYYSGSSHHPAKGLWQRGQVLLPDEWTHLYKQLEWNLCLQVLHSIFGSALLVAWSTL